MAIPNIVPRNNNDGETLGTQTKQFSNVFAKDVTVNDVSLNTKLSTLTTGVANNNTAIATLESTKLNTSTYTSKLNSVDSEISSLSTTVSGKVDTSTYNTKMTSLDGSISELSGGKANDNEVLHLSGGTMTSGIIMSGDAVCFASRNNASSSLTMEAGVKGANTGAYVVLRGKDIDDTNGQGAFSLGSRKDNSAYAELVGYPDGRLYWGNITEVKEFAFKRYLSIPAIATKTAVGGTGTASVDGFVYVEGVVQDAGAGSCWLTVDNAYQIGNAQYYGANLISMLVPIRAGGSWAVNFTGLKDLKLWFFSARSEV